MQLKQINNDYFISGQVGFADLQILADHGIKSLICARPDDEEGNQPRFSHLQQEAEKVGIKAAHVPIKPGQACGDDVDKFAKAYDELPKPILGYCRSGMRAHALWELNDEANANS
ncbi:TIGR01244 family sulfur transferase [Maritalea mediterranea]|uniref:TIGR01244 family sulfur transferase n=1 Tax=Maritalea mediterranea TaxID=2909667 RepID=A0ABS9E6Z1_9HYPH|nr:TIGR01244 family sulfur transferase [Maritalea mediterranea]MCF4097974.1 TIGR01244 family sulfur transferase [Maritalea mediterranea]